MSCWGRALALPRLPEWARKEKRVATKNFWVETTVDGRKTKLASGPRAADGGFSTNIFMRADGERREVVHITGRVTSEGELVLDVEIPFGLLPHGIGSLNPPLSASIPQGGVAALGGPGRFSLKTRR